MKIDSASLSSADAYRLLISFITPRPIAWTGTRSLCGVDNLAPFSFFMGVSSSPPSLALSVARGPGGTLKDTARNILDTGAFTVSAVSVEQGAAMAMTAGSWPPEVSEFARAGLTPVHGDLVAAPYPAEARAVMECRRMDHLDLGAAHLFVGEVLRWHLSEEVAARGREGNPLVDTFALDPLARLGGVDYARLGERLSFVPPRV